MVFSRIKNFVKNKSTKQKLFQNIVNVFNLKEIKMFMLYKIYLQLVKLKYIC